MLSSYHSMRKRSCLFLGLFRLALPAIAIAQSTMPDTEDACLAAYQADNQFDATACLTRLADQTEQERVRATSEQGLRIAEAEAEAQRIATAREEQQRRNEGLRQLRDISREEVRAVTDAMKEGGAMDVSQPITRDRCLAIDDRDEKIACFVQLRQQTDAELATAEAQLQETREEGERLAAREAELDTDIERKRGEISEIFLEGRETPE